MIHSFGSIPLKMWKNARCCKIDKNIVYKCSKNILGLYATDYILLFYLEYLFILHERCEKEMRHCSRLLI